MKKLITSIIIILCLFSFTQQAEHETGYYLDHGLIYSLEDVISYLKEDSFNGRIDSSITVEYIEEIENIIREHKQFINTLK